MYIINFLSRLMDGRDSLPMKNNGGKIISHVHVY